MPCLNTKTRDYAKPSRPYSLRRFNMRLPAPRRPFNVWHVYRRENPYRASCTREPVHTTTRQHCLTTSFERRPDKRMTRHPNTARNTREQQRSLRLAQRACIPPTEVFAVLEALSNTLIFNSANPEERLALASRLRHWAVEDGTYLIREGDGDSHRSAIFMIGKKL